MMRYSYQPAARRGHYDRLTPERESSPGAMDNVKGGHWELASPEPFNDAKCLQSRRSRGLAGSCALIGPTGNGGKMEMGR